jgi:hypothetical protein
LISKKGRTLILGLDISTSITGITLLDDNGEVKVMNAIDTRKYKNFFQKAEAVKKVLTDLSNSYKVEEIFIEQSLQSFRSGFSSAQTLSTLSRFNGIVSWMCYSLWSLEPQYLAATSARKLCGIKIPKGEKAKPVVLQYVLDNEPTFVVEYTKHGNPKPDSFDRADSWVIAKAGFFQKTA